MSIGGGGLPARSCPNLIKQTRDVPEKGESRSESGFNLRMFAEEMSSGSGSSSRVSRWLTACRRHLGLDRAVGFTVLARAWTSLSGLVTVALIARLLSPSEQGYYYTYSSLVALQMVFELGFSQVVMQLASHERAHLSFDSEGRITGNEAAHGRLASVLQITVRWYGAGAVLFAVIIIPFGLHFFSTHQHPGQMVGWQSPWIAASAAAVFAFFLDPLYSFFEGCGFVSNVAHMRWMQAIVASILAWSLLLTHHGLYAPAGVIAGQVLIGGIWIFSKSRLLRNLLQHDTEGRTISWRQEIWPFQWRIAISWISGYFVYQTFNPFLFAFRGPVAAGQMGMSLTFANAIMVIAMAWVSTKAAPFGMLIAQRKFAELDRLFSLALAQSTLVAIIGATTIWLVTLRLNAVNSPYSHKLLGPLPFGLLLAAAIANHLFGSMGTYLRAHKQEVLFQISVAIALAILVSNYVFAKTIGSLGMVSGYLVIITIVGLGFGTLKFRHFRRIWHLPEPGA